MKIIRYVDMYKNVIDEEGNQYEEIFKRDLTLPVIIDPYGIGPISPYIGTNGRLFKNVSMFNYEGEVYKVVGNYIDLDKRKHNQDRLIIKGYYNAK